MFDYAEDDVVGSEPGFGNALTIETVRRDYFINVQNGVPSEVTVDSADWPAKTDEIDGIVWLPRILPKARAKLRGELPDSAMYSCGGDRRFFHTHNILPAEFLALVWRHLDDDDGIITWVKQRSGC
jgi:SH3-like domain-containing protein